MGIWYSPISVFSVVMSIICFSFLVLIVLLVPKRFIRHLVAPLFFAFVLIIARLTLSIELPGAVVIRSSVIYPAIYDFAATEIFSRRPFGVSVTAFSLLMLLWAAGAIILIVRYMQNYVKMRRNIIGLPSERYKEAERLLLELEPRSAGKDIKIYRCEGIEDAFISGIFKPEIYLPGFHYEEGELSGILMHEYVHFHYRDTLIKLVIDVISRCFWWNPLVSMLRNKVELTLEIKCDLTVVSKTTKKGRVAYAKALKIFTGTRGGAKEAATRFSGTGEDDLYYRIDAIKNRGRGGAKAVILQAAFCIITLSAFFASYIFVILPYKGFDTDSMPDGKPVVDFADAQKNYLEKDDSVIFDSNDMYLVENVDGTYSFYRDGLYIKDVEDISIPPYSYLPVK